jgi:hypothetical protein
MLRPSLKAGKPLSLPRCNEFAASFGKIRPFPPFTSQ